MKRLLIFAAILSIIAAVHVFQIGIYKRESPESDTTLFVTENVVSLFPDADRLAPLPEAGTYTVLSSDGSAAGYVVESRGFAGHIKGWGGETPVLIGVSPENRITGIKLLENNESGYVLPAIISSGLLEKWDGIPLEDASEVIVDAVTSATITSRAIERTIKFRVSEVYGSIPFESTDFRSMSENIPEFLIVFAAVLVCFFPVKHKKSIRIPLQIVSIVYLGFMRGLLLSIALFASWIRNPELAIYSVPLLVLSLSALAVPLFTGRSLYCGYICPFGALQELIGKIPVRGKISSANIPSKLKGIKIVLLLGAVLVIVLGMPFDLSDIEPFTMFVVRTLKIAPLIIAAVFLLMSLFISRPWCRYCCPTGCFLELIRKKRKKG